MKHILLGLLISLSLPASAEVKKSLVCSDAEFGAGHFKLIIPDSSGFYSPREQKAAVMAFFWVKGEMYLGQLDSASYMPDWNDNSGWFRSQPSPLAFSLCNWKKCPVKKVKLMVHTKDQMKGEGNIKFILQRSENERIRFDRKLNCELK